MGKDVSEIGWPVTMYPLIDMASILTAIAEVFCSLDSLQYYF